MCCFSDDVQHVSSTKIFARASADGRQFLVYQMQYEAERDLAMILPLPTPPDSPEDALRFIDLSEYPTFFEDMEAGFPIMRSRDFSDDEPSRGTLVVQEVGSFEASFVPHQRDFERLDPRFRLPEQTWEKLPQYGEYGFAVFKLKPGAKTIHPIAFEFPRREPEVLFFPTVHIHHGEVEPLADFDHALYCQHESQYMPWPSVTGKGPYGAAQTFMKIEKTQGVVAPELPIWKKQIRGMAANEDILVEPLFRARA